MDAALKIRKLEAEAQFRQDVLDLLKHPVYSLVVSFIIIEALQQIKLPSGEYFMSRAGTVVEGAILTKEAWTALGGSQTLQAIIPLLGKAAAAAG